MSPSDRGVGRSVCHYFQKERRELHFHTPIEFMNMDSRNYEKWGLARIARRNILIKNKIQC